MKRNYFYCLVLLLFNMTVVLAQEKTVSGTVTDDYGLPLPGANVIIENTDTGTQSDFDGNYSISIETGESLTFSYVGFETQVVKVDESNVINVLMKAGSLLDQVVITGYSTRNKTVQTSSVVSISASEISQLAPTTSVDNLLQGKAAGVQVTSANGKPGQGAFVRIRGTGSLSAGASSPLYIIDGAPLREEDLGAIATEDIENITILKDAATTARYGSRGANGVVVITTKKGNRNKEAIIRYSTRYGVTSRINPNFTMMNISEKFQYEAEMYSLGVGQASNNPGVTTDPGSDERNFLLRNATNWEDLILKEGVIENNNVSISGGSEKMDYFFAVGHVKNTGIIDQLNGFERLNTRLNVNFDAKDWLTVGVNVGYSRSLSDEPRDRNNVQNPFRAMYDYNPWETEFVLDEDGNVTLDANGNPIYSPTLSTFNVRGALLTEPNKEIDNLTLASVDALVKFSKNLSYGFNTSISHLNRREESYSKPGGILDNLIGDADNPGNKFDTGDQRLDMTISNRLNYNLRKNNHNLNALALFEYNFNEFNRYFVRSIGFPSALLTTQSNAAKVTNGSTNRTRLALISYGGFLDYDFSEKYLVSASIRRDGSSNFGEQVQWGTFWSGSVGWNIAKEKFFKVDAVNDFKIRAAYGTVGNRNGITRYAAQDNVAFNSYPGGSATIPSNIGNPELKWETTTTANVGLEVNLFNRRLRGVFDYFDRNTTDLLFQIPRADESGVGFVFGNLGEINNSGFEISLQGDIVRNDKLTWTMGGNILLLENSKIVSLPDGEDVDASNTYNIRFREGVKINEHFLIRYAGVDPDTGRPMYLGADDVAYFVEDLPEDDNQNRVFQGKSTIADREGGFFNNIVYKGFGLRTDFVFKYGNWINNFVKSNLISDGLNVDSNQAVAAFNYWQQAGDTGVEPSPIYRLDEGALAAGSDRFLERGDYIRMRSITLSYTFPKSITKNWPVSSLRIYGQGQNLITFTRFFGDPEVGLSSGETISFGNAVAPGEATLYSYPNTKSIQFGIDVSF